MITALRKFLQTSFDATGGATEGDEQKNEHALRVATAALLVEMSRADFEDSNRERETILRILGSDFALDAIEAKQLLQEAEAQADAAVSLHEFTRLLHEYLDERMKHRLIATLWRVALADSAIDKYEEHLLRKVADLLYVRHSTLIRLKHEVMSEFGGR